MKNEIAHALWRRALILALVGTMIGCQSDVITCALSPEFGIQLNVNDAATLQNLNGIATVTITRVDPPYDSLTGYWGDVVRITHDSPGKYRLRVDAVGYVTATREVNVPRSSRTCSTVVTQTVVVALQRKP